MISFFFSLLHLDEFILFFLICCNIFYLNIFKGESFWWDVTSKIYHGGLWESGHEYTACGWVDRYEYSCLGGIGPVVYIILTLFTKSLLFLWLLLLIGIAFFIFHTRSDLYYHFTVIFFLFLSFQFLSSLLTYLILLALPLFLFYSFRLPSVFLTSLDWATSEWEGNFEYRSPPLIL